MSEAMSGEQKTTAVRLFSLGYKLRMRKQLSIEHKSQQIAARRQMKLLLGFPL
jgi:hypothetical protein